MRSSANRRRGGWTLPATWRAEIWAPTQVPNAAQQGAAAALGIPAAKVTVHTLLTGGGFGRRLTADYAVEAAMVSKAVNAPVKVVWTREDDLRHDWYRPCSLHRLEARLAGDGLPVAWRHRVVAPSILRDDPAFRESADPTAVEGAKELPYRVPDLQVEYVRADLPMQLGFWRSVGHSYNAFAVECFIDEIAVAVGRDPVALRRTLLAAAPRHLGVLDLAVAKAGPRPKDPRRGKAA